MKPSQNPQKASPPDQTELEAIAWFTRINGKPSATERRDFEHWRKADPMHDQAYRELESTWMFADDPSEVIAAEEADKLEIYLETIEKSRKRRRQFNARMATLGSLVILVVAFSAWLKNPYFLQNLSADYIAEEGQRQTITLTDGSTVLLDADSALAEHIDATLRRVVLLRGSAFFDVISSNTPFIVDAGGGETWVTGTAFSVEINKQDVAVTVARGSVRVSSTANARQTDLQPGQRVRYNETGLGPVREVLVDDILAWRDGRLIFENMRLGDVISHIDRYHTGRIFVLGSALGNHRVSGNLPLNDPEGALASLRATVGFHMNGGGGLIVIRP